MNKEQAEIVIKQLGGYGKLKAMVAASNFTFGDFGMSFNFKGSKKYNFCTIELNSMDRYKMKISKFVSGIENNEVIFDNLFLDQLKEIFEKTTGLMLSL